MSGPWSLVLGAVVLLVGTAILSFSCGLMAALGWRAGGRSLPRPAATAPASSPPRQWDRDDEEDGRPLPVGVSGYGIDGLYRSATGRATPQPPPWRPDYSSYWPSYRSDKAL